MEIDTLSITSASHIPIILAPKLDPKRDLRVQEIKKVRSKNDS